MKNKNIVTLLLLLSPIFVFSFMNFECDPFDCNGTNTSVTPEPPSSSAIPLCVMSTDGGNTWDTLLTNTQAKYLIAIHKPARSPVNSFLCSGSDTNGATSIFRTTDAGINWTTTTVPGPLYDIDSFLGAYNYFWDITIAVGDGGLIMKSTNCGVNWTQINSPTTKTLNAVAFYPGVTGSSWEVTAIAVGDGGTIIRTTDMGETWTSISSGTTSDLEDVCTFHPRSLYTLQDTAVIVGDNSTILITTDLGLSWIQQPFSQNMNLRAVAFSRIDGYSTQGRFGLIGGLGNYNNEVIYKTTNGGATWVEKTISDLVLVENISIIPNGSIFVVGRNKVIKSIDNGEHWAKVFTENSSGYLFKSCYAYNIGGSDVVIAVGIPPNITH